MSTHIVFGGHVSSCSDQSLDHIKAIPPGDGGVDEGCLATL